MILRLRIVVLALVATFGMAFVTGCGGGSSGKEASSSTDVNELLKDTFSGGKKIDSGKLSLALRVDAKGSSSANGPISVSLSGPFQSQGKGKLPKLDLDAKVEGAGQNISAGVVSTGDKGFVKFQGANYVVSDSIFQEFKKGFEQAQSKAGKQQGQSLATLGIDPRRWLKNPKNEGDAKVGDTDVIKITGDVDVPKLLDDVNTALGKAKSLGVQGSANLPSQLTAEQKKQAADAVKKLNVEIYTGKDDQILRRILVNLTAASQNETADVSFDLQLLDVNEDQSISEPSGAKPFDQLLSQLGGLSGLSGSSGSGSGSGSGSSGSGSASSENLQKYSQCIEDAGTDSSKARKCADLLTAP